ncbi:MAG: substrate-binding domain-containing protein [Clostridia bacterium]
MKSKKFLIFTVILLVVCASLTLVACGGASKQSVTITGSSSVSPLMQKLATEFERLNKNIQIRISTSDSSTGITDTIVGKNDIGMSSRNIKDNEKGITETKIADDGVVMIVNNATALKDITSQQVYDLYASGVAVGGVVGAISREEGSGTRDAFDGLIVNKDGAKLSAMVKFADCVDIQNSTGNVMVEITSNITKVGYISLGSLSDSVSALTFNGVKATADNIKNKTYKLARPFMLTTKEGKPLSSAAQRFMDFILGAGGQKIVTSNGYIAL